MNCKLNKPKKKTEQMMTLGISTDDNRKDCINELIKHLNVLIPHLNITIENFDGLISENICETFKVAGLDSIVHPEIQLLPEVENYDSLRIRWNVDSGRIHFLPHEFEVESGNLQHEIDIIFYPGDYRFIALRNFLLPPVVLAGAGIGSVGNTTLAVLESLQHCEVCLYDSLIPDGILGFLPSSALKIPVGKRKGNHLHKQNEINNMILNYARLGKGIVRLKGGDPSVFGRLSEEVDILLQLQLPFRVLPGVGSMSAASASTGFSVTRRNIARGFTVMTPRRSGSHEFKKIEKNEQNEFTLVFYMAANCISEVVSQLLEDGHWRNTPAAMIYNAGSSDEIVVNSTLDQIADKCNGQKYHAHPGLLMVGESVSEIYRYPFPLPLGKKRILYWGDDCNRDKFRCVVESYGAVPLFFSTIENDIIIPEHDAVLFAGGQWIDYYFDNNGKDFCLDQIASVLGTGDGTTLLKGAGFSYLDISEECSIRSGMVQVAALYTEKCLSQSARENK